MTNSLQPDYKASVLECYMTATEIMLTRYQDLGVLALIAQHNQRIEQGWPSWVPRLGPLTRPGQNYHRYCSSGSLSAKVSKQCFSEHPCVRLSGITVGTVKHIAGSFGRSVDDAALHSLYCRLTVSYGVQKVAQTAVRGISVAGVPLAGRLHDMTQHRKDFDNYIDWNFSQPSSSNSNWQKRDDKIRRFHWCCIDNICCRSLFEMDGGFLGMGVNLVEPGDQVVILFGGRMPFVLRPVGNLWRLVDVCFVHGIMQGEAIEHWQQGIEYEETDFDIY